MYLITPYTILVFYSTIPSLYSIPPYYPCITFHKTIPVLNSSILSLYYFPPGHPCILFHQTIHILYPTRLYLYFIPLCIYKIYDLTEKQENRNKIIFAASMAIKYCSITKYWSIISQRMLIKNMTQLHVATGVSIIVMGINRTMQIIYYIVL